MSPANTRRERKAQPVPALTRPRKQRLPSMAERVLPNGLRVVAVRRSSVPLVHLRLRVPNAIRRDADLARTTLLARTMMLGTSTRSQGELAEALQGIGGGLRVDDSADGLAFSGESLRSGLGDLLGLLAEVLIDAAYPRTPAEREAGRLTDHLRRALAQPGTVADQAWLRRRYGDHPYGRSLPTPDEVAEVAPRSLKALHRRRVVPDGSLLVLVGDLSPARVLDQAQKALDGWTGGPGADVPAVPDVPHEPLLLVDRPGAVQSNLRIGGAAPRRTDDWYAAGQLANGIYGGSFSSRLTQNIREDKGYTYSPHSSIRHLRGDSRLVTSAEVATEVTAPAMVEVLYELGRIAALPPKPEELEATVQYLTGTLALGTATQAGLAETLVDLMSDGKGVDWLQEYPARLAATTPDEVMEAAARMLAPAKLVCVVVGDADAVEPGLSLLTDVVRR
jgi:predicted Zn-dependent peptidase